MSNLDWAVKYWNKGWSIIPIRKGEKIPAISEWKTYQTRRPTLSEVTAWWTSMPDANIALVCGQISGVIVVDIDSGHGSPDLQGLTFSPTLVSKTGGGGSHFIYKWRPGLHGPKVGFRTLVDIRSDNSYIVLPPSLHVSGNHYEWSSLGEDEPITEAPKWLELSATDGQNKPKTDWVEKMKEPNAPGTRNMSAAQVAGKILYDFSPELWDTLGLIAFQGWNRELNNPPLPERELMATWDSIKRTHLKSKEQPATPPPVEETNEEQEIVKNYVKNKTEGTYLLAKYIVKKYNIITVGEHEREMFVYQDGYYRPAENLIIFPEVQRILQHHVNKNAKTETLHKIADMTTHPRSIFEKAPLSKIPLANGVYDYETKQFTPHSPDYYFTFQFPIQYKVVAECPKTEAFFDQILNPDQRRIMEEWLGFYFIRNYMFKKAMIFVGEGDTGKTTLLEVITHLIGNDNISSISLQKMSGDKFSAAHLYRKHGNIVDELSARDVSDTGAFKIATGGGNITGEYKFGNQFNFINYSKFTFACNRIPDVSSDANDDAYFNRWIVTRFENKIEKKIPNFIATLTTEEERSGLFNLAMRGLERLMKQGKFSYDYNAQQTKVEMLRSGSSLAMFVSECLEVSEEAEMTKDDLYHAYTSFCKDNMISAQTKIMVGKKLTDYAPYASDGVITILNEKNRAVQIRGWRNVKIKDNSIKKEEEKKPDNTDWGGL